MSAGASFLIPYVIMLVVVGLPAMLVELSVGQYARVGANKVFGRMVPAFKVRRNSLSPDKILKLNLSSGSRVRDAVSEVLCQRVLRDRVRLGLLLPLLRVHLHRQHPLG